jgi:hypothetical protein
MRTSARYHDSATQMEQDIPVRISLNFSLLINSFISRKPRAVFIEFYLGGDARRTLRGSGINSRLTIATQDRPSAEKSKLSFDLGDLRPSLSKI